MKPWRSPFSSSLAGLFVLAFLLVAHVARAAGEIKIGASLALSGPSKSLGQQMKLGIETYLARVNRDGGVGGKALRLLALDDGYEPSSAARNMDRLIDEEHVLAVVGNIGTPTAEVTVPIANAKNTLLFGAFTGAGFLRKMPPDRYVMNYRASYAEETAAMVAGLSRIGIRPYEIAFFSQNDSYGDAGYAGAVAALKAGGYKDAERQPHGRYKRNTVEVEDALLTILGAEIPPRAIIMIGTYAPSAKLIRMARRVLSRTLFLNVSFVGGEALAATLGEAAEGVIVTQVVPHFDAGLPICRDYRTDLVKHAADAVPGFVSLEGYIAARIFVEGLRRAGAGPTRESVVDALLGLGTFDIGLGTNLRYDDVHRQASQTVWPTVIRKGKFLPLSWDELARSI